MSLKECRRLYKQAIALKADAIYKDLLRHEKTLEEEQEVYMPEDYFSYDESSKVYIPEDFFTTNFGLEEEVKEPTKAEVKVQPKMIPTEEASENTTMSHVVFLQNKKEYDEKKMAVSDLSTH
jgi:hypothetical protein